MNEPCHFEGESGGVLHVCNRAKGHGPPHILELFKHGAAREPFCWVVPTMTECARCKELEAKIASLYRLLTGQRESFERTRPLCPDHRDKQTGKQCLACLREAAERRAEAAEAKLENAERRLGLAEVVRQGDEEQIVKLNHALEAAHAKLAEAERERDDLRYKLDAFGALTHRKAAKAAAAAEAREKALREAWERYGWHSPGCEIRSSAGGCECGYERTDAALAAGKDSPK